jgi:hypothetical protein
MSNGTPFPAASTVGQGSLAGDPGLGIGANPLGGYSTTDTMYGGFDPFGDPNANQAYEVPGGGLAGFTPIGGSADASGATSSASTPGNIPGTVGGNTAGSVGSGCDFSSVQGALNCLGSPSALFPQGVPGANAAAAAGAAGCSATNLGACFGPIGDFAGRAVVIVLGFIFVAAGLFMFGRTVPFVRHAVPDVLHP